MIPRRRLFWKYVVPFVVLVSGALVVSGSIDRYFSLQAYKAMVVAIQDEKARSAAVRIEAYVKDIERQMEWVTQPQLVPAAAALDQRQLDYFRLQRQVHAITELAYLDAAGKEQLRVSRLAPNVTGSQTDFSGDPKFREARQRTWFGPVYFRKGSEPYMTMAVPHARAAGVTVAEVNLKFIWDVVSRIRVGDSGLAYAVDTQGNLLAHPEISLVLQKTSLADVPHVRAALMAGTGSGAALDAKDRQGRDVVSAYSVIPSVRWLVFVEQPRADAFAPVRAAVRRTTLLVLVSVGLSIAASLVLARRMIRPIRTLQEGAARIGAGELGHRIDVRTGDEFEQLAEQFNRMTVQLQESYATLEQKVVERTRELTEALEQQTATSEILKVISSAQTDAQPVFESIVRSAVALCAGTFGGVFRFDGALVHVAALHNLSREALEQHRRAFPAPVERSGLVGRAIATRAIVHVADVETDLAIPASALPIVRAIGYRSMVCVPMLKDGVPAGTINVARAEAGPFTDKQIALLQTFADQAVIAIENVRLFTELQEKNRAVTEALEQQTATGTILGVISSSPTDVQPVFDAIVQGALRLLEGRTATLWRLRDGVLHAAARAFDHPVDDETRAGLVDHWPLGRGGVRTETVQRQAPTVIPDTEDPSVLEVTRQGARILGYRSVLLVPMIRDGVIGIITVSRREPGQFSEDRIALLRTFADQAVIAVENVRLFTELQEKNRAVTEALEQQTATSEILRVISSSPTDVQPVFKAILESAVRLCEARFGGVFRFDGELIHFVTAHEWPGEHVEVVRRHFPMPPGDGSLVARAIRDRRIVQVRDYAAEPTLPRWAIENERGLGARGTIALPMLLAGHGSAVGGIVLARSEAGEFSDSQVALLQTFADQAVIAIENVRLFTELQERTRELGRTVSELEALGEVSRSVTSTLDVDTVLQTIVSRASQLAGADGCSIFRYDEEPETFVLRATHGPTGALLEARRAGTIRRGEGVVGRLPDAREPIQVPDIAVEHAYQSPLRDTLLQAGYRALLAVPLIREGRVVGGLVVSRKEPGEFPTQTVELLKRFATQSSLALWNASLYRELDDKSRELEVANRHKSEFLASMSHELRTPLNAVIGFSEVLIEKMFGDLNDKQEEYLRDIYSSGRHLLSLINDILDLAKIEAGRMDLELTTFDLPQAVDNALTLVRGRAEAHGIRLAVDVDRRLGDFVGDERKFKQILLNLLSNAVKFTPEGGRVSVRAALANGSVEVSVADTGIGIAPEDRQTVFEEFRQVGTDYARKREGTGLGLALTKRFVELHGGSIWLKSAPGEGSTFTFSLPLRTRGES